MTSYTSVPARFVTRPLSLYSLIRPLLFRLPAETAHHFALSSLKFALQASAVRRVVDQRYQSSPFGNLKRFGLSFRNPVGLAAGFDKNGEATDALCALGFGFIEVGTVTSEPQPGNPKPRNFRLPRDRALVNRLGFNNCGAKALVKNLKRHRPDCVLGINIGKSRSVPIDKAIDDYLKTFEVVYEMADYIAVNVSSPNTPQLRELQSAAMLSALLDALQDRNRELANEHSLSRAKPLLLKIAPDLVDADIESIIGVAERASVAGIIATNTTTSRDGLQSSPARLAAAGEGGLSGAPLRERSNHVIRAIYRLTNGAIPIVGVGGVFNAEDAWKKICAGASLIQLYTGFIYEGPGVARQINEGLRRILSNEGFVSFDEAVGCGARIDRELL
ncbi:MAG TPA: quinone-dependent dihydroorotate dehydrogenase [Pyrinomonadaceae bacterium]